MAYDWVVFDADETLFRFDAKRGLTQLLQSYDVDFTETHFKRFKEVNAPYGRRSNVAKFLRMLKRDAL